MPELPEVETIVRQLDKVLAGKKINDIEVLSSRSFTGNKKQLLGTTIEGVDRRAKMIIIRCHSGTVPQFLVIHLKMTGQMIYLNGNHRVVGGHPTPDWVNELPSRHTRVVFELDNGAKLFFNDLRLFGWIKLKSKEEWNGMVAKLPPDVVDKEFTLTYFSQVLSKSRKPVKVLLTDQDKFGGVGNIYANDALYLAKIDPRRKANEVGVDELKELYESVKKVIKNGIKYGGASVDKYVDAAGVSGNYQEHFLVYNKDGEKCKRDGGIIKKIKLGGRGTYYCSVCQK